MTSDQASSFFNLHKLTKDNL